MSFDGRLDAEKNISFTLIVFLNMLEFEDNGLGSRVSISSSSPHLPVANPVNRKLIQWLLKRMVKTFL